MEWFHLIGASIYDIGALVCDWLYHWQTVVGAVIALVAARLTIGAMRQQMNQEADRHRDAQRRKQMAARAKMPDALSDLTAYVRGCGARLVGAAQVLPEEPVLAIITLKEGVEFIEDSAAKRTFELVSWYQVFRARMVQDVPSPGQAGFLERIYDAALLQAHINSLFDYARNKADKVDASKLSREEIENGLKNAFTLTHMIRYEELYEGVKEIIYRRHE